MAVRLQWSRGPRRWSCLRDLLRQPEVDILFRNLDLLGQVVARLCEPGGRCPNELFRRRGACGETDRLVAVQQPFVEPALAVDERRLRAGSLRNLDEPLRVRARLGADPDHE